MSLKDPTPRRETLFETPRFLRCSTHVSCRYRCVFEAVAYVHPELSAVAVMGSTSELAAFRINGIIARHVVVCREKI